MKIKCKCENIIDLGEFPCGDYKCGQCFSIYRVRDHGKFIDVPITHRMENFIVKEPAPIPIADIAREMRREYIKRTGRYPKYLILNDASQLKLFSEEGYFGIDQMKESIGGMEIVKAWNNKEDFVDVA